MSNKQAPEDVAAFKRIIESDVENKKCFECQYPHPLWCNINHGVFICMECSGVHRGLGVHLSFVRSATIDDWTAWRPEKLKQMEIGGNRKARLFFERLGVPKQPIRARYEHDGALMYKDKLEAEARGEAFSEATWKVPEWKTRMQNVGSPNSHGSGGGSNSNNRFQGMGSAPQGSKSSNGGDWFGALSDGWGKVASATSEMAAATTKSVKDAGLQDKATESATWAWGNLTSYATSIGKMAAEATNAVANGTAFNTGGDDDGLGGLTRNIGRTDANNNDDRFKGIEHRGAPLRPPVSNDDDGLSGLTRNVERSDAVNNERFKGIEHRAEKNDGWGGGFDDDGDDGWGGGGRSDLKNLAGNLPKTSKYQGIGSSPNAPAPVVKPSGVKTPSSSNPSPVNNPAPAVSASSASPKKEGWDDWDNNDEFE